MRLNFKKIKWRNILGFGNYDTEIRLDASRSTLVTGLNGAGKSTMVDALSFALFGRAFRSGVSKSELVNRVTGRETLVSVEFEVGGVDYVVERGMRPSVFRVVAGGAEIESGGERQLQAILEGSILRMNHKTFCQVLVLGVGNFTPFMRLPAYDRREVVKDLVPELRFIGVMSELLAIQYKECTSSIESVSERGATLAASTAQASKQLNRMRAAANLERRGVEDRTSRMRAEAQEARDSAAADELAASKLSVSLRAKREIVSEKLARAQERRLELVSTARESSDRAELFRGCECPTCRRAIDSELGARMVSSAEDARDAALSALSSVEQELSSLQEEIKRLSAEDVRAASLAAESRIKAGRADDLEAAASSMEERLTESRDAVIEEAETSLAEMRSSLMELMREAGVLSSRRRTMDLAKRLLSDDGIKSSIITQYVPAINSLVNKYLEALEFVCTFSFDSQFEETIRVNGRDGASYGSFSQGERLRVDIALLFAWRTVAQSRNSVSSNLLILDEVLDASLDAPGAEEFMRQVQRMTDGHNVFVISHHGDGIDGKFEALLKFSKSGGFSRLEEEAT